MGESVTAIDASGGDHAAGFIDGDTLVMILTHSSDFFCCADLARNHVDQRGFPQLRRVLIDCSDLADTYPPGLIHFINVARYLDRRKIRLMLLDAPAGFCRKAGPLLPDVEWISSRTGRRARSASRPRATTSQRPVS